MTRLLRWLLAIQGAYYVVTGVWPLLSMRTFELVTGPKTDDWLVKTVGLLAGAIGVALLVGSRRRTTSLETIVLAIGAAFAFAAVDLVYALGGRISPIYLADAAVELVLLVGLFVGWWAWGHDS